MDDISAGEIEVDPEKPLVHACHTNGVDVPTYCYHPGLTPKGSCRICQVEVKQGEMPPRVMASCRTAVAEGMIAALRAVAWLQEGETGRVWQAATGRLAALPAARVAEDEVAVTRPAADLVSSRQGNQRIAGGLPHLRLVVDQQA